MKVKKVDKKIFFTVLSCLISAVIAVSAIKALSITYISVVGDDYDYSGFVSYSERVNGTFEDSRIFTIPFKDALEDVTRMCVIRNQMETNGKYNPNKAIDITSYANRTKNISNDKNTAKYRLDDLIKWGNYGYDYQAVSGSRAQLEAYFLSLKSNDIKITDASLDTIHLDSVDVESDIKEAISKNMSEYQIYEASDDESAIVAYFLIDRYKSYDGKNLIYYANNLEEYEILVKNLCVSADSLFSNYAEYSDYLVKYSDENTNIMYCYQMTDLDGNLVRFDNLNQHVTVMTNDELSKLFTSHSKYVCFNPDKLQTATNIKQLDAVFMKQIMSGYEYSFGDDSRIWVAIDEKYPVHDVFYKAKCAYEKDAHLLVPSFVVLCLALILLLILIVLMTLSAGKIQITYEDGTKEVKTKPSKFDIIPIELYMLLAAVILFILVCMVGVTYSEIMIPLFSDLIYIVYGCEAIICEAILVPLYLVLVRKLKCRLIWNGSLLKMLIEKLQEGVIDLYDNGQIIARTWLPFLLFLAFNLVMVLLGIGGIIIAFIFDMIVGFLIYKEKKTLEGIVEGITMISDGDISHQIDTVGMHGDSLALANAVNSIGDGIREAVQTSLKDEKLKSDLITNVSHDIKTPLTSIINFVGLLKKENIEDERIKGYIEILDQKSQRLKELTNDLVEASKISSGNITLNIEKINIVEFINQTIGEFIDKFDEKNLSVIVNSDNASFVMADSRGIFRVIENLYNNIYKYALAGTRIYIDIFEKEDRSYVLIKNISSEPLNVDSDELTERFVRGDVSRRTEGSGLGLSIAKSLTEAMNGSFTVTLDGDLFKVTLSFPLA